MYFFPQSQYYEHDKVLNKVRILYFLQQAMASPEHSPQKYIFISQKKKQKSANGKTENNDVYYRDWGKKVVIEEIGELTI